MLVGNMISDFVKGKKKFEFPAGIQQGIDLHRRIDAFTDGHPATKTAKEIFRPHYRLYSGAFIDVIYDHFLATDTSEFSDQSLLVFSGQVYSDLEKYLEWFPQRFAYMFSYMKNQNWLYNYRTNAGTINSFGGLVRRAAYMDDSTEAVRLFKEYYQPLEQCYRQFWKDAKPFAQNQFELIRNSGNNT